ncbi:MAG: DUF3073 domain-containing protein [Kineosporiaceae bacterium]|jgi:hypothetical protein
MGRGRQKAKQTKVARQLKYFSPETDYDALQRELATGPRDDAIGDERADANDDDFDGDDGGYAGWTAQGGR